MEKPELFSGVPLRSACICAGLYMLKGRGLRDRSVLKT